MAAGAAGELLPPPVPALSLYVWGKEPQAGRVSHRRPHTEPETKVGDPRSPDAQPLAFALWSPSVRSGASWKPVET